MSNVGLKTDHKKPKCKNEKTSLSCILIYSVFKLQGAHIRLQYIKGTILCTCGHYASIEIYKITDTVENYLKLSKSKTCIKCGTRSQTFYLPQLC